MSKKTSSGSDSTRTSFRRYSPGARITAPQKPPIVRFGNWLGHRSRLVRSIIAAFVALDLTCALVLMVYAFVLNIGPQSLSFYLSEHLELLYVGLVIFIIIGFGFYWVGWRLLFGFDFGDEVVEPGQGAGLWVMFALFVLITMIIMMVFTTIDALQ